LFIRNKIVRMTNEMETIINEEIQKYKDKFLSIPCFEPFYNMIISPNGNLKICAISGETNVNVKNVSLKDAWFSKPMIEARKKLRKGKLFDFCSHCCVPIFLENRRIRKKLMRLKHAV
ncbi:MAG: SPASM domain-containing protein, partial [Candidatus Aenigmarchaeota archaeon]|nr:SPASM domain-containing protein [Candidatus Aenigmarchaeota archaeon]